MQTAHNNTLQQWVPASHRLFSYLQNMVTDKLANKLKTFVHVCFPSWNCCFSGLAISTKTAIMQFSFRSWAKYFDQIYNIDAKVLRKSFIGTDWMANMIMFSICRYQLSNDDGNKGQQETNSQKVRLEYALHFFYLWVAW